MFGISEGAVMAKPKKATHNKMRYIAKNMREADLDAVIAKFPKEIKAAQSLLFAARKERTNRNKVRKGLVA